MMVPAGVSSISIFAAVRSLQCLNRASGIKLQVAVKGCGSWSPGSSKAWNIIPVRVQGWEF